jgi:hypothetical protein
VLGCIDGEVDEDKGLGCIVGEAVDGDELGCFDGEVDGDKELGCVISEEVVGANKLGCIDGDVDDFVCIDVGNIVGIGLCIDSFVGFIVLSFKKRFNSIYMLISLLSLKLQQSIITHKIQIQNNIILLEYILSIIQLYIVFQIFQFFKSKNL